MRNISIAFVDDHPALLEGLTAIFSRRDNYTVVGTGANAQDIVAVAERERPDVLVVDLNIPGDSFAAISRVGEISPSTKKIAFTACVGIECAVRALEAGVNGYVLKGSTSAELTDAIQMVLAGDTFITPSFASKVIVALRNGSVRNGDAGRSIKFSVREDQVVKLLLLGRTNREIALHLRISEKTVKHYMTLLMQKLNARNRLEAIIAAQKLGEYRERDPVPRQLETLN